MENEIEYMRLHPPRCLGCGPTEPEAGLRDLLIDNLGENSTVFSPVCGCGDRKFFIIRPIDFAATTVICRGCGKERTIFDPRRHGYDGELGHYEGIEFGDTEQFKCSKCRGDKFEVAMAFQYAGETDILEDDDAPSIHPEDLFGWMAIAAKCKECSQIQEVTEAECA